jgi:DNA-binding SARP family transcriptional activator/TolB-like protein
LSGRKTRALLAILGLSAPRPVLRSRLAEMLWSRRPEEQARASLRQEIHRLGESLAMLEGEILAVSRDNLGLRTGAVWLDVEEVFRASPDHPEALSLLDAPLLEELDGLDPAFDVWLADERERLIDHARFLAEHILAASQATGRTEEAIGAARRLLEIDRSHEGAWRALMRAHAARGERGLAIQAYERCRSALAERLAAHPSEETQRVAAEIRAAAPLADRSGIVALPPLAAQSEPSERRARADRDAAMAGHDAPRFTLVPSAVSARDTGSRVAFLPPAYELSEGREIWPLRESRDPARRVNTSPRYAPPPSRGGVRIGVLPLRAVSAGPAETPLCASIAEEITASLTAFRGLIPVSAAALARISGPACNETNWDEAAIRHAFALDFLIDGTLQGSADRLRIALRLLDLRAGNRVVWSCRFDRADGDLLSLQDEVAAGVAARIDPQITLLEAARLASRATGEEGAYETMLHSVPLMLRMDRPSFEHAGELLRQAIALDPEYAPPFARLAFWHVLQVAQGWSVDRAAACEEAGRLAKHATALDSQDAFAHTIAGLVRAALHRHPREGLALHHRALALNPALAQAWALSAAASAQLGELDPAAEQMRRYKRLTPLHPYAFFLDTTLVTIALLRHDHEEAVRLGREICEMNLSLSLPCKPFLAALGHLGLADEATAMRERLLAIEPGFSLATFRATSPLVREIDREHVADGLKRAGIPEESASPSFS